MNALYDKFRLPKGAKFYVYSEETRQSIGAITSKTMASSPPGLTGSTPWARRAAHPVQWYRAAPAGEGQARGGAGGFLLGQAGPGEAEHRGQVQRGEVSVSCYE